LRTSDSTASDWGGVLGYTLKGAGQAVSGVKYGCDGRSHTFAMLALACHSLDLPQEAVVKPAITGASHGASISPGTILKSLPRALDRDAPALPTHDRRLADLRRLAPGRHNGDRVNGA
jgi:hypothetical protein